MPYYVTKKLLKPAYLLPETATYFTLPMYQVKVIKTFTNHFQSDFQKLALYGSRQKWKTKRLLWVTNIS
jgi:hypothetical protein